MIQPIPPSSAVWLVVTALAGFLFGWWVRGRRMSGRELTMKRRFDNQMSAVDEDAKRSLGRARAELELKQRKIEAERDLLHARLAKLDPAGYAQTDLALDAAIASPPSRRPRKTRRGPAAAPAGPTPGEPDDLQRIKGIGPSFEARLHQRGYTTFRDLAGWNEEDLDALGEHLGARIRLKEWSARAAELHREKYGREA